MIKLWPHAMLGACMLAIAANAAPANEADLFMCQVSMIHHSPKTGGSDFTAVSREIGTRRMYNFVCTHENSLYKLVGDTSEIANQLHTWGGVDILVPLEAINSDNTIDVINVVEMIRHETTKESLKMTRRVLVIAVVGEGMDYSQEKITKEIFGEDNRSLRTIMKDCSGDQFIFEPVVGEGVTGGVVMVEGLEEQVCGLDYRDAMEPTNKAIPDEIHSLEREHTMYLYPWCVEFGNAVGVATYPGTRSWYSAEWGLYPKTLAHEIGHNLHLHHSGAYNRRGRPDEYGDKSCVMGNRGTSSFEGSAFCFNAPKMQALGLFNSYTTEYAPAGNIFKRKFRLIGLDDVVNENGDSKKHTFALDVKSLEDDETSLVVAYNRAEGVNSGVPGYRNKVVIYSRKTLEGLSYVEHVLEVGDAVAEGGIRFKFCDMRSISNLDLATVAVYHENLKEDPCACEIGKYQDATGACVKCKQTIWKCPKLDCTGPGKKDSFCIKCDDGYTPGLPGKKYCKSNCAKDEFVDENNQCQPCPLEFKHRKCLDHRCLGASKKHARCKKCDTGYVITPNKRKCKPTKIASITDV